MKMPKTFCRPTNQLYALALSLTAALPSTPLHAFDAEISVDGEIIPAHILNGAEIHKLNKYTTCPPHSNRRVRDEAVLTWLGMKDGRARKLDILERDQKQIDQFAIELASEQAKNDQKYADKRHWLTLLYEADSYRRQHYVRDTDEQIMAEYERLVQENDPEFVNVPLVKVARMESTNVEHLTPIAKRLRDGETWDAIAASIDPYEWNSHNHELWFTVPALDRFKTKGWRRLNIDGLALAEGDVIGPFESNALHRMYVILKHKIEKQLAPTTNLEKYGQLGAESRLMEALSATAQRAGCCITRGTHGD